MDVLFGGNRLLHCRLREHEDVADAGPVLESLHEGNRCTHERSHRVHQQHQDAQALRLDRPVHVEDCHQENRRASRALE